MGGLPRRHLRSLPSRYPAGGRGGVVARRPCRCGVRRGACPLGRLPILPLAYLSAPIPLTPFPAGRGSFLFSYARGFAPCIPGGWTGRGTGSVSVGGARREACPLGRRLALPPRYPAGGLPSLSPADAAFSFCFCPLPRGRISGGQIRQAPEKKCRLIKIPRGGHTDATAQCGDSRLGCRQCLPRRNRNRVRKQKKHRRNRRN